MKSIGGYELLEVIGEGASATVYRGRTRGMSHDVAVKVLRVEGAGESEKARFLREGRAATRLHHRGVVKVHHVGEDAGRLFMTMELVHGETLEEVLRSADVGLSRKLGLIAETAETVQVAHEQGVVHRDLKPANVLVDDDGRVRVTDFGLALIADVADKRLTRTGVLVGTPHYMAPEQAMGEPSEIGPAADIHALGVQLYLALTGELPYDGGDMLDLLRRIAHDDPVPPKRLAPRVHRDLETICLKALEKSPADRYESAAALAADIRSFLAGESVAARRPSPIRRARRVVRRHPVWTTFCVMLVVAVLSTLVVIGIYDSRTRNRWETVDLPAWTAWEGEHTTVVERGLRLGGGGNAVAAPPLEPLDDVHVRAEFLVNKPPRFLGVFARGSLDSDTGAGYYFTMDGEYEEPHQGRFVLMRAGEIVAVSRADVVRPDSRLSMELRVTDWNVVCSLNGRPLIRYVDPRPLPGHDDRRIGVHGARAGPWSADVVDFSCERRVGPDLMAEAHVLAREANLLLAVGRHDEAARRFETLSREDPSRANEWRMRAGVARLSGTSDPAEASGAEQSLAQLLDAPQADVRVTALAALARQWRRLARWDEIVDGVERLGARPDSADGAAGILLEAVVAAAESGDWAAVAVLTAADLGDHVDPVLRWRLQAAAVEARLRMDEPEEAISLLEGLVARAPTRYDRRTAVKLTLDALEWSGQYERARTRMRDWLAELEPGPARSHVRHRLALGLIYNGEYDAALAHVSPAAEPEAEDHVVAYMRELRSICDILSGRAAVTLEAGRHDAGHWLRVVAHLIQGSQGAAQGEVTSAESDGETRWQRGFAARVADDPAPDLQDREVLFFDGLLAHARGDRADARGLYTRAIAADDVRAPLTRLAERLLAHLED